MSRTKKLAKNSVFGILSFTLIAVISFVIRKYFIDTFGFELTGLNTVLSAIISTLSLTELGIGTAIVFSLYKPLAENDGKKIAVLINLYKKIFYVIALIVFGLGLVLLPFLPLIVQEYTFMEMFWPYLILLVGTAASYSFSFNHTLLTADQNYYIISIMNLIVRLLTAGLQLLIIFIFVNFVFYILVGTVLIFVGNVVLSLYVRRRYPYLKIKTKERLCKEELKTLKSKVFALVFHKIGNYLVNGVDSILIVIFINVTVVGYFSSYQLISANLSMLLITAFAGLTASLGNVMVTENITKTKEVLFNVKFVFVLIYSVVFAGIFVMSDQFLILWIGFETVLPIHVVLIWALNIFLAGYSQPLGDLRAAAGVFEPDKYLHIILAGVKLIVSSVLVLFCGIAGILLGTTICLVIKELIVLPWIGNKYIFKENFLREYYTRMLYDFLFVAVAIISCYFANKLINTTNGIIDFILGVGICVVLPAVAAFATYFRRKETKYLFQAIKNFTKRKKNSVQEDGSQ